MRVEILLLATSQKIGKLNNFTPSHIRLGAEKIPRAMNSEDFLSEY